MIALTAGQMTLDSAVAAAAITAIATIIVHWFEAKRSREKMIEAVERASEKQDAEFDKRISVYSARTDEKLDELTREVREHNNFARRVPVIEQRLDNVEHKLDKM